MCVSNRRTNTKTAAIRAAVELHMLQLGRLPSQKTQGSRRNTTTVKRTRRPVRDIYKELGKTYFRRAYRMNYSTFCKLYKLLAPRLKILRADKTTFQHIPNGRIHSSVILACAIRQFAGGTCYDLATSYGVSTSKALESVNLVIDAINTTKELTIQFPTDHQEQLKIAKGFEAKSTPRFSVCVGALDGMLVWMEKPTDKECEEAKCDTKKFHCIRKSKFGLNLQGVCDVKGRYLDVTIGHPGSTSDYLAFVTSKLHAKLETPGFLAPGLVLYGDNAYVCNDCVVTPFKMCLREVKTHATFISRKLESEWNARSVCWCTDGPF